MTAVILIIFVAFPAAIAVTALSLWAERHIGREVAADLADVQAELDETRAQLIKVTAERDHARHTIARLVEHHSTALARANQRWGEALVREGQRA